ncbi:MAG TPA: hypothetical protein VHA13_05240 [Gammaproteobacteria bacterium]|nr:hypothetical protein [Gammaproteobacteria bacterium]
MPIDFNAIENNKVENLDLLDLFSPEFAKKIAAALVYNTSIKKIDISYSNIIDEEFELIANALLKRNAVLEKLNLQDTLLTNKSLPLIADLLEQKKVTNINISNNKFDENSEEFKKVKALIEKEAKAENRSSNNSASSIKKKDSDSTLIDFNAVKNNEIADLDLSGIFTLDCAKEVAGVLVVNTSVKRIDISFSNLQDDEFEVLAKALSNRSVLSYLNIERNLLTNKSLPLIADLLLKKKVLEINIRKNQFDENSEEFKKVKALIDSKHMAYKELSTFDENSVRDRAITNNEIKDLDIIGSLITLEYAQKLAASLAVNTSVVRFDISFSNLVDEEFEPIVSALLKRRGVLDEFNIQDNLLTNKSLPLIADLLEQKKVINININNNKFDENSEEYKKVKALIEKEAKAENKSSNPGDSIQKKDSTSTNSAGFFNSSTATTPNNSTPESNTPENGSPLIQGKGLGNN